MKPRIRLEDAAIAIALLAIGGEYVLYREHVCTIERAAVEANIPAKPDPRGGKGLPAEFGDDVHLVECPWFDLETGEFVDPIGRTRGEAEQARVEQPAPMSQPLSLQGTIDRS